MKLLNGMTFGAGIGLITAGLWGIANGYSYSLTVVGIILVAAETCRHLFKSSDKIQRSI